MGSIEQPLGLTLGLNEWPDVADLNNILNVSNGNNGEGTGEGLVMSEDFMYDSYDLPTDFMESPEFSDLWPTDPLEIDLDPPRPQIPAKPPTPPIDTPQSIVNTPAAFPTTTVPSAVETMKALMKQQEEKLKQQQQTQQQLEQTSQQTQQTVVLHQSQPGIINVPVDNHNTSQKQFVVVVPASSTWITNPDPSLSQSPQIVIQSGVTTSTACTGVPSIAPLPVSPLTPPGEKLPISPQSLSSSKGNQVQKRKADTKISHNAIEQRYRKSINDRIETLKQLVVGSDAKIQKSGILQKAIEQIMFLRKRCLRLEQDNKDLKSRLDQMKGAASVIIKTEPPTPPASDTQSPRPSPEHIDFEPLSPKSESSETSGIIGMTDRSRLTLCIFMFAVLLFNPFGFLLGKAAQGFAASPDMTYEHAADGSRTLKGVAAEEELSPLWNLAMSSTVWFVNALLILGVIIQILIKGEPVTKPNSEASIEYWKQRQAAETEISRNEHGAALTHIQLALKALGRNIPVSGFDMWACTVWNTLRFLLNKVFIGRWLAKRAGGYEKDDREDGKYTTAETSARDAAMMYLKYLQIALVSNKNLSAMSVTSIGLVTLNLAHCAGNALSCESIAEVYATVALAIKATYPKKFRIVSRYFFSKGRTYAKEYNTPAYLTWMNNAMAYQLVKQEDISFVPQKSLFAETVEPSNPLSCLTQGLQEKMLESALYQVVAPTENTGKKTSVNSKPQDALHILSYLESHENVYLFGDCQDVCKWWAQIIVVAAHWMLGDEEAAERRYNSLEKLPSVLEFSEDTLPKAALLAFKARKLLMSGGEGNYSEECRILCDKASTYLQRSIQYPGSTRPQRLHEGIHLLVADWLLSTRTSLWQQSQPQGSTGVQLASSCELNMYQQDLSILRRVASTIKSVMPRLYIYQAVSRFMAGANPAQTQQLLDRTLRQMVQPSSSMFAGTKGSQNYILSDRDRGKALVIACRYLPESILSNPNQKEKMLDEAVQCFEQAKDRWSLKECQKLLANIKKECGDATEISRQAALMTS